MSMNVHYRRRLLTHVLAKEDGDSTALEIAKSINVLNACEWIAAGVLLENRSVNLDLDHDCYAVTFFGKGGLTVQRLHYLTCDIVRANIDVVI